MPENRFNHTSLIALATQTDITSIGNSCVIENFELIYGLKQCIASFSRGQFVNVKILIEPVYVLNQN